MKLLDEIIEMLTSNNPSIENALFKAQVLAHRLDEPDLKAWVASELKGYSGSSETPEYRKVPIVVLGTISNGVVRYSNHTLPILHLDAALRSKLERLDMRESIAAIVKTEQDEDSIQYTLPPEYYHLLSKPLRNGFQVERAWGRLSHGAPRQIVAEVRSRLLDFSLKLSDRVPDDRDERDMKSIAREVQAGELFKNSVFGDNTTIIVGSGNTQNVSNSVVMNDFGSLERLLLDAKVSTDDIDALKRAVASDQSSEERARSGIGPRVSAWIASMLGKAGTEAWKISVSAAGGLLGKAIAAYYGIE